MDGPLPDLKLKFDYMILIYLNNRPTFSNLYHLFISQKNFHLFLSKNEILVKKTPTSLHKKKTVWRQWTLILIVCVDVHMGLDHPSPVHMRSPEPPPLRVDVIMDGPYRSIVLWLSLWWRCVGRDAMSPEYFYTEVEKTKSPTLHIHGYLSCSWLATGHRAYWCKSMSVRFWPKRTVSDSFLSSVVIAYAVITFVVLLYFYRWLWIYWRQVSWMKGDKMDSQLLEAYVRDCNRTMCVCLHVYRCECVCMRS